jgi:2-polyprenyl-3-methyl-5-hydroxy-6-metoxy-1,4-benzoquinol methylase
MPTDPSDAVQRYVQSLYNTQPGHEWEREERHRTEFAVTRRALAETLPAAPARVLDCGGGPGRYAIELARQGYDVTLFDLSVECLRLAREEAYEANVRISGYEHGTATDLSRFPDASFDAVLLLGPLYHLLEQVERLQALQEGYRVLKPGGVLFAAFITRFASLRYAAAREIALPLEQPDLVESLLDTGKLSPRGEEGSTFVAYFAHPAEVIPLCQQAGFEISAVLGVEGVVSMIEEGVNTLSGEAWEIWADLNYRLAQETSLHGGAEHLLVVAHRPHWRAVIRQIAQQLKEANIPYKLVGGASVAIQGVPIPVKDLDIETDVEAAYWFQDRFSKHAVQSVSLSASEIYRSHFGRFDFDGVTVEIMGDIHRREGDRWVPSAAKTVMQVDLEGVPVNVSWLEEEILAYIRRGRLERAAQCLPYCDHVRLLTLLKGEQPIDVL